MLSTDDVFAVYRDLAVFHDLQGLGTLRDRFLVLAAAAAQTAGRSEEAEQLRQRLLRGNGCHLLRPFASMAQALISPDVQSYVEDLRQQYPPQAATDLLASVRGERSVSTAGRLTLAGTSGEPTGITGNSETSVKQQTGTPAARQLALPPTAPVIDLDNPAETLKVFPNQEELNAPTLPAWEELPRKSSFPSVRPVKLLPATAAARPATVPVKRLLVQEPLRHTKRRTTPDWEEEADRGGRWLGPILAVIIFALGLYLAALTVLQPFWP